MIGEDVAALEDAAVAFMPEERRQQLREDEIVKLEQMQVFEVIEPSTVPKGIRILYHKWVETPEKARLTAADKKEYGAADDLVHCPAPSAATNAAIEILATVKGYCFRCFDVTSAFPHADEVNPWVVMFPPKEWIRMGPERENKRWRMKKALYGRRPAAANFRDFFEDCVGQIQLDVGQLSRVLITRRSGTQSSLTTSTMVGLWDPRST